MKEYRGGLRRYNAELESLGIARVSRRSTGPRASHSHVKAVKPRTRSHHYLSPVSLEMDLKRNPRSPQSPIQHVSTARSPEAVSYAGSPPGSTQSIFLSELFLPDSMDQTGQGFKCREYVASDDSSMVSALSQAAPSQDCSSLDEITPAGAIPTGRTKQPEKDFLALSEEIQFMQIFVDEIGPWADLFDHEQHFSQSLPYYGLRSNMLLKALLACGARHSRHKKASDYYDTVWTELFCKMQNAESDKDECAMVAIVLNIYEALCPKTTSRTKHLARSRKLIKECGWNTQSTGIASACFWMNVGLDVLNGYSPKMMSVDPCSWGLDVSSSASPHDSVSTTSNHIWFRRILAIFTTIVKFQRGDSSLREFGPQTQRGALETMIAEWLQLKHLCDQWDKACPRTMKPLGYQRASNEGCGSAFPKVW